jgi:chorismate mutase
VGREWKGVGVNVRAIRGATALQADDPQEMAEAVTELMTHMLTRNQVSTDELISVILTCTPDLHCQFPALALRESNLEGLGEVPLLCAQEMAVEGAMPRVVRILAQVQTELSRSQISHVYLRGAQRLRRDLAS